MIFKIIFTIFFLYGFVNGDCQYRNNELTCIEASYDEIFKNLRNVDNVHYKKIFLYQTTFPNFTLDAELFDIKELSDVTEELLITLNNLQYIDSKALQHLKKLNTLGFSMTLLREVPVELLSGLSNIERFWVSYSRIESVDCDIFKYLPKIYRVGFEGCMLKTYNCASNSLREVFNSFNRMDKLDVPKLVKDNPNLKAFYIQDNMFFCQDLETIIDNFEKNGIDYNLGNITLTDRPNVKGIACYH